jgi:hypothetical protein
MKGLLSVLAPLLLVSVVLSAGSIQSGTPLSADPGGSDPFSRIIANIQAGISHPLTSVCTSPAFTIYERVTNPGGESKDLDHCIQFFAVQAGDTSQCPGIKRGAPMTKCYLLIASKKNDPAICDQIPVTNDMQAYLKNDCLWDVAIQNNNPAACEAMGDKKISRMLIGEISRQTCQARLASGQIGGGSGL